MTKSSKQWISVTAIALMLAGSAVLADRNGIPHTKTPFVIKSAEWSEQIDVLRVQGKGQYRCVIEVYNEGNHEYLGETEVPPGKNWYVDIDISEDADPPLNQVPCTVGARQVGTEYCKEDYDTQDVQHAPDECGPEVEDECD
jgi:hypothetical protein